MSDFDPDAYFASKFDATLPSKLEDLAAASASKVQALQQYRAVAEANVAAEVVKKEADKKSWVGRLGLEEGSFTANRVNDVASLASGTGRLAGHIASLPVNLLAQAEVGNAQQSDYDAFNRYNAGTATEADMKLLNSTFEETSSATRLSRIQDSIANRARARSVNDFTDITSVVNNHNRDALASDLGDNFQANWNNVTGGWDALKKANFIEGTKDVVSGVAGLLVNAGDAAINNPAAAREYIVENAPQLLLGSLGKAGQLSMAASNVGYASDYYSQGIEAYQAKNNGAMPPADVRQRMAVMAASLAVAEHAGDSAGLAAMKLTGRSASAGATGVKGILAAGAEGFATEAATEAYQTYAEGEVTGKPASAQDIYTGGVIGGIAGAGLSGGGRAFAQATGTTPEQQADREAKTAEVNQFKEAAAANDITAYMDKANPSYDPSKAIGVLLSHAQLADTSPEVKEANLKQAGEIVSSLEEQHAKAEEAVNARSPEAITAAKAEIATTEQLIKDADPADGDRLSNLNQLLELQQESLADISDKKEAMKANTQFSKLSRQLQAGRERIEALSTEAGPRMTDADVSTLVDEVSGQVDSGAETSADASSAPSTTAADRLINLSMVQPDSLSPEVASKLAEDTTNALTAEQRSHLRAFSAARILENKLSTMGKVSEEVLAGSDKNVGIAEYKTRIASALASNSPDVANRQLQMLSDFAEDHASKAKAARAAMKGGLENTIVRLKGKGAGWTMVPAGTQIDAATMESNGALKMQSARLAQNILTESQALNATVAEMKSAIGLKFGVQSVPSAAKTIPAVNNTTQENVEPSARPEQSPGEGEKKATPSKKDVHTGKKFSTPEAISNYIRDNKLRATHRMDQTGRSEYTLKLKIKAEGEVSAVDKRAAQQAALAKREQAVLDAQAKLDARAAAKAAAAEQPAVVSEANPAPVAEAAPTEAVVTENKKGVLSLFSKATTKGTEVAYQARNLIADYFSQDKGTEGTLRPLASVADFLSSYTADPESIEQFLKEKLTNEQKSVVSAFMSAAKAWAPKITSSLRRKHDAYQFEDLMQFFITEEGDVDMDENVKMAISFAAFQAMIDLQGAGRINDDKAINGVLGKDPDTLVDPAARQLLAEVGTLEKVLKAGWGQTAVSALGMRAAPNAPANLMPALEAAMGAHVFKLLMELGVVERTEVTRAEMNEFSNASKRGEVSSKDEQTKVQFVRLVRDESKAVKPLVQKVVDVNKGTQSVLTKLFGVEAFNIEPTTEPVKLDQEKAGDGRMGIPSTLKAIVERSNKAAYKLNTELFNFVLGQVTPEIALEMAGAQTIDPETMHKSNRLGTQAKNDGLEREYNRLMEFVKGTLSDKLDTSIFFQHTVWVQQRVGILTNMINPQTSKLQRHMLYQPSWEAEVNVNNLDNFLLRVAEGLGVKTDKKAKEKALAEVHEKLQQPEIKAAINVLNKARSMTGLTENEQAILAAGVKAGGENFHSLSVLMAMANYVTAKKSGQTTFKTQLMAEVDGVTNGPMLSHLLMGAATSVTGLFSLLNRGGFYQQGSSASQYNVWRSVAGHMDLYEKTTSNVMKNARDLISQGKVNTSELAAVTYFTGVLENTDTGAIEKAGRNIIKTPLTAMVFGSSVPSAVDSMADKFVESVYESIEGLVKNPENREVLLDNLNRLGVRWPADATVQEMLDNEFSNKEIKALKGALKATLGEAVKVTMKQDFEEFLNQRSQFNSTAQLAFEIYDAAYRAAREAKKAELIASGELAVNPTTKLPVHDLTSAQEKEVRESVKALEPVIHTAMSKDSGDLKAGMFMGSTDRSFSADSAYRNEVHFGTEIRGTGKKSSNVTGYETNGKNPGVAMMPLSVHSFDSMISHYAAKKGNVLNIHDAHGAGLDQIQTAAQNLNQAVWESALNYSPAQEMSDALMRTVRGLAETYKDGIPAAVLANLASSIIDMAQKQEANPQGLLSVTAARTQEMAARADGMKLDAMAEMAFIDQYAMEGGHYQVSAEDRIAAASLRSALASGLSAADQKVLEGIESQLDKAIKAELAKRDGKTLPVDQTMDMKVAPVAAVAELGKPVIESDAALVGAFEATPVMDLKQAVALLRSTVKDGFGLKLLSALERFTASDITINYVTPSTVPADLLAAGGDKSRGWYVSKADKQAIYVLSPDFKYSGLTPELLLHEMTHAALARTIQEAQAAGTGDAFALVQELQDLMAKAKQFVQDNKLTEFDAAVNDVQELVSWGMTNADFQNKVLVQLEMTTQNKGNALLNGMKSFVQILSALVFGRKNDAMATGMDVLITNVSGLFVKAGQNKAVAKQGDVVLNQVNNGQNVRDLTTHDVFNALEQNNSGATLDPEFSAKLRKLLDDFVARLHGPMGSFKADIMEQTTTSPDAVMAEAMVNGVAPLAFDALAAGLNWTQQEAFVAEQVHATVLEAFENKTGVVSVAYRELAKLYAEVRTKLTPADFATGNTPVEIAEGQALYDFIFEVKQNADGRSDYLARFAALGMAHSGFSQMLQMATTRGSGNTGPVSFNERLNQIFEKIMNWFTGKMTNTVNGQNADAKLSALVNQLVRIEERKRAVLKLKSDVLSPVETIVNDLGQAGRARLEAFGKLPFFQNNSNGLVRLTGSMTSAFAGDRFDAIMEGFNRMRDQHFRSQQGVAASLVNEFRGSNVGNVVFHFLLRASKHLEGIRKDLITYTGNMITSSFANNGMDLTKQQKAGITSVFLRADLSALLGPYTMDQISNMVKNKAAVQAEIATLEGQLDTLSTKKFNRFFINASKTLAYYKATGKVTSAHMLMNAGNISKMYGTNQQNRITVREAGAVEAVVDQLVSLYALSYTKDVNLKAAQEVLAAEEARTDGGNGIELVLRTHKELQAKSKNELFAGNEALQMKGYTSEIYDPYMAVVVANEAEGKELLLQGYTRSPMELGVDQSDPNAEVKHIYHLRDGGLKQQLTGVFSYTGLRAKGSRVHNGNLSIRDYTGQQNLADMAAISAAKAKGVNEMFTNANFNPAAVKDTFFAPVLNGNGDVVNYRYLMTDRVKDKLLDRDNRPEKILGTLAGNIFDKVASAQQNRKAVAALKEQYNQEFAERPESYMTVGPKSTDPQLREIWTMLPNSTKQAVREIWGSDQMKVRVDLLDINFGYRKLSVADAFQKNEAERNFVETMFVQIMTNAFDEKAGLRVRQAEDIWQAVVKATKANLVVKSISTMTGNLRSNWSQLLLMGVSPAKILEHHRVAFKGAWAYKKDSEELFRLGQQIKTGYLEQGQTAAELKHRIARLEDSIARNPIKPLIDAGLMPTIVEDVQTDDDIYSYKSRFVKKTENFTKSLNPHVVNVGRELLMLEGSTAFRTMSYATQISDFLARYTLYQVKTQGGMSDFDAVQLASDAFINYDVPTHRMVQYANDSGLVMFTKYYMRIQKMLAKIYKENPGRVMALIAAEHMLGDQPTVLDSSMITRWGNPLNLGALDYPGSLSALTTVRILSSPFSSGGNPAE